MKKAIIATVTAVSIGIFSASSPAQANGKFFQGAITGLIIGKVISEQSKSSKAHAVPSKSNQIYHNRATSRKFRSSRFNRNRGGLGHSRVFRRNFRNSQGLGSRGHRSFYR